MYNHLSGMCTMLYQRYHFSQGQPTVYTLLVYDLPCVMIHLASLWRRVACEMSVTYNVSPSLPSHCSLLCWNWKTEKVCAVCTYAYMEVWQRESGDGRGVERGREVWWNSISPHVHETCMLSQQMAAELLCVVTR